MKSAQRPAVPPPAAPRADCRTRPWPTYDPGDPKALAAAVAAAHAEGFVVLRGAVHPDRVSALRARIFGLAAELGLLDDAGRFVGGDWSPTAYTDPRWLQLQQRLLATAEFLAVGDSPALLDFFARLFGEPARTRRGDICRIAPARAPHHTTRPHQDHWYLGGPPVVWTAWTPMHPCPPDRGGLGVLPRSHGGELRAHGGDGAADAGCAVSPGAVWACGELDPGDAVLFHCLTVHRAWHNLHAEVARVSVDYRYLPGSADLHTKRIDGSDARG